MWWIIGVVVYFLFACVLGTFLSGSTAPYQKDDE